MINEENDPKKSISNLTGDAVDGSDVKGGFGGALPPAGGPPLGNRPPDDPGTGLDFNPGGHGDPLAPPPNNPEDPLGDQTIPTGFGDPLGGPLGGPLNPHGH